MYAYTCVFLSCISCLNKQNTEIYCFINIAVRKINLMADVTSLASQSYRIATD